MIEEHEIPNSKEALLMDFFWILNKCFCNKIIIILCTDNGLFVIRHFKKVPCRMMIDIVANVTMIRTYWAHKLGEKLIFTPPCITFQTVTSDRNNVHGKVYLSIAFGNAMYNHMTYVVS
ncbi:hypothetical protein NPIL_263551 [Nephila pilipes]|uniref:Uncharacterized protein n=1 Tax=Nephila pilipes TaxID=299642 RepID=A0A8X6QJI4_NEPPI|nr:hypothetical protein NPIL_263551 [Nephila pilipes]